MPQMKTPGVFIVETNAFPNSIVEVATAVPAFIGYTERASFDGKDLSNTPVRITSMHEYLVYFGDPPRPAFTVEALDAPSAAPASPAARPTDARGQVTDVTHGGHTYRLRRAAGKAGGRFLMHPAMRHVGPVRRELAIPTVMNMIGPLANPAAAGRQVIGVADIGRLDLIAGALHELGTSMKDPAFRRQLASHLNEEERRGGR